MAKLSVNDFIQKHKKGVCITFLFEGYFHDLQRRKQSKAKASGKFKFADGQELPTPNEVVSELMKSARGDYVLTSERMVAQNLTLADPKDAEALFKLAPAEKQQKTPPQPCTVVYALRVSREQHIKLAQNLKLLGPVPPTV